MNIDNKKMERILLKGNYLSKEDIQKAKLEIKKNNKPLVSYLLEQGFLTKDLVGQAVAESFGVSYSDLNSHTPSKEQILQIPEVFAKKYRCVLYEYNERDGRITVTTDRPQKNLIKELSSMFPNLKIHITYSLSEDISSLLLNYQRPLETRFSQIIASEARVAPEILDEIFEDAYKFHSSDIHFEPRKTEVLIRFRIDGVLQEAGRIPKKYYENILNRIKVQSRLRIDKHLTSQDGSMRYEKDNNVFDMRTSIVPTVEGEKVVLRILTSYIQGFSLGSLGLSAEHQDVLEGVSKKPFGMILVTGPTGSGKTTTLYAILKLLLRPEVNITTVEDPVEYKVVGINQIQVNSETDLTFAKALRSIVRQDPDIILVGEIRDDETAEIAVNASLTGHLLLSTFHANDAATAIPRLLDMGVEPFLLASTVEVIVAQRLVRKICENCKHSVQVNQSALKKIFKGAEKFFTEKKVTLYEGKGCSTCGQTGYSGRTAIFEFISITPQMKELILKRPSVQEIQKLAQKNGANGLFDDGIRNVKNGVTTLEEVMRVASPAGNK